MVKIFKIIRAAVMKQFARYRIKRSKMKIYKKFIASDTYRLRFKFKVSDKGIIQGDIEKYDFLWLDDKHGTLKGFDAKTLNEATQFTITVNGYETEEAARNSGQLLKRAVLSYGAKFRVGIDVGKDIRTGGFTNFVKDKIYNEHGIKLIDDIHGVSVYSEKYPNRIITIGAVALINAKPVDFFIKEILNLVLVADTFNDKILLAMELLTASIFEKNHRTRFLTLVLALETLLEIEDRPQQSKELVQNLIDITLKSKVDQKTKESLIGSLKWLKKESISKSLRLQSLKYLKDKNYGGLNSEYFIKKCYEARSQLVHTGKVDEKKYDINTMAANLEVYLKDLISVLAGI